jgi:NADH-quinone oxidoreductase subunit G
MCRLCLVEVEGAPKPMPSCVTTAMDGQVVRTQSESALDVREGVLEFYLVNHPLDCPICDMSGECNLQDYVHSEGREHGRSREPKRVFGRDDFGGDVLYYGDRCVMCTRCVRFMSEVEQDHRLTVVERGNRSVIDTFFDEGLEGTYWHGNVVDICPVGALVSKDFLYKARAWDLEHTPSVCPGCAQGCNIDLHTRDNLVQRVKPRENLEVNGWWMCDYGRLNYEWINHGHRLEAPLVRVGERKAMGWKAALRALLDQAATLEGKSVKAVASPYASNEDLGAFAALVRALGGGDIVYRSAMAEDEVPLKGFPQLARRKELAPNGRGISPRTSADQPPCMPTSVCAVGRPPRQRTTCCLSRPSPSRKAPLRTWTAACSGSGRPWRRPGPHARRGSSWVRCSPSSPRVRHHGQPRARSPTSQSMCRPFQAFRTTIWEPAGRW